MRWTVAIAAAALALAGCSSKGKTYAVTGTVSVDGKPVAFGKVYFDPDPKTNPSSPQGYADIKDGRFDTRQGGRGSMTGAYTLRIEAFDGRSTAAFPYGQLLFDDYREKADFPAEDVEKDIRIPASAVKKRNQQPAASP